MAPGFDFQMTPQYGINLKSAAVDSLFFRGNGPGFKMDAGYSFGNFGIGLTSGFFSPQTDKTKINEFLSRTGVPADQMLISTGSQQNMYVLLGPSAVFGNKIHAAVHAKGGLFINNGGFVNIRRQGAVNPIYRNEPSSKSVFPGFAAGLNLDFPVSHLVAIGFSTDYLNTKSEVVNYDIRRGAAIEGIKLSKNISSVMTGISVKYNIKSPRDAANGKQLGKPKYEDLKSSEAGSGLATGKTYQPGQPQFGYPTVKESCGPVTVKKTNSDGSIEEMTFACPDDVAVYNQRAGDISERPTWTSSNPGNRTTPNDPASKGVVSGRVTWLTSNPGIGIVTNRSIQGGGIRFSDNQGAAKTTPNSSFGTMVRITAREAGSGMATGKMFEPVFSEGQGEVCNPCLVTVSYPVYKGGMGNIQSNPMYEEKSRIAMPDDCDDGDPGIADLEVSLVNISTGQVAATTKTEKCGGFFFANVPDGFYKVRLSGKITGKKGYDINVKSKMEANGQIVWGGETVSLILDNDEKEDAPSLRAGISTSRSNLRTKAITLIDADTDGDGSFDSHRAIATLSDGTTNDITEDASVSRVNKIDAFTIKQKVFYKMHRLTRTSGSSTLHLTGVAVTNGETKFRATATFSDGSMHDVSDAVTVNSSGQGVKQYTVLVADLDDDGNADAVLKISKSRSNINNNRLIIDNENSDELNVVKSKTKSNQSNDRMSVVDNMIWSPRSNTDLYAIAVADLDGDGKAEAAINNSNSNIKNLRIASGDLDGDGIPEAVINTSRSNIKNLAVVIGDINGDGAAEMLIGGSLPGGAIISAALRSPGDPIPGLDVKLGKKGSSRESNLQTNSNGRLSIIRSDMEPDTYTMTVNNDIYISDETLVIVRGWDPVKKESAAEAQRNRDVKVTASQNTQSLRTSGPETRPLKWIASEAMKAAINTSHSNIKNLRAALTDLEMMSDADQNTSGARINNTKSNLKNLYASLNGLEEVLTNLETMEKNKAFSELNNIITAMNPQFMALGELLNAAGKQYATISNVLKTRHDAVKNSIGNIR
jgi:hypothetical protein